MDRPGVGHQIQGEVYRVDEAMLAQLDILEDHPTYVPWLVPPLISPFFDKRYYRRRYEEVVKSDRGGKLYLNVAPIIQRPVQRC